MSADRDVNRIVRSWLEEGVTALPDRVLDTVLDQLPATPQRRAWWPARRLRLMNLPARLAVAAAAVAAVAVIGVIAIPKGGGAAVQPPASPAPVPTPSPSPLPLPSAGALAPGTYYIDAGPLAPARVAFTVPAGWVVDGGFVYKDAVVAAAPSPDVNQARVMLVTWIVTHVYTDACHWQGKLTPAGTPDQLVTLLRNQKGRTASTPTDVVLGGAPAKRIDMTVPAGLDVSKCDGGTGGGKAIIRFWPDPGPDESGGLCCSAVGSTDVVYVLNAGGKTWTVVARHQPDSPAGDLAELDGVMSSIKIGP
jgi:hypothetical protein